MRDRATASVRSITPFPCEVVPGTLQGHLSGAFIGRIKLVYNYGDWHQLLYSTLHYIQKCIVKPSS